MAPSSTRTSLEYFFPLAIISLILFIPLFTVAKSVAAAFILLIVFFKKKYRLIDSGFSLLLTTTILYCSNAILFHEEADVLTLAQTTLPPALYLLGVWLGTCCKDEDSIIKSQITIGISLSILAILSIGISTYQFGFSGLSRSMKIIGLGDTEYSATVIGGLLALTISMAGVSLCKDVTPKLRLTVFILAVIGLACAVRLGSRTYLVIFGTSIVAGYILNKNRYKLSTKLILFLITCSAYLYLSDKLSTDSIALTYYSDRINQSEYGFLAAGGRTERWLNSIFLLLESPTGWDFRETGFAHNLWLDTARLGGWASFVALILLTKFWVITLYKSSNKIINPALKTSSVCIFISFFMLFFVEPIFDGFIYPFSAFCAFLGCINCAIKKNMQLKPKTEPNIHTKYKLNTSRI